MVTNQGWSPTKSEGVLGSKNLFSKNLGKILNVYWKDLGKISGKSWANLEQIS